ncbi:ribonuclease Z [Phormidesmis priestleyi ULC007]|uniref:Ribonuclease Z n=1 Tax=Phormidesmis priestleyi ULC007 TaxID=1920490 RepID=A0A2T1DGR4_9CYAN|nr:ribonuclease Z [Phormidesmis priestleyi]PSB19690.1 ribonuclease Z [Phormidesmis priestleyi ULC007]PZO53574.1 MAG: ribonuclease Z [Phormidesmis priestleyi]
MQITFLGTSSGVPTRSRNVSGIALRLPQRAEVWLFDCGEGTQHQILRSDLRVSQIRRIFVTHMHGDHTFGLMGLLASCGLAGNPERIDIYGPPDLDEYLKACRRYSQTHFSYPVKVHTVKPGVVFEDEEFSVSCAPLKHRVPAFGYRITEKDRPGHFDVEKAKVLEIPSGPLYGKLKRGEVVVLPDGRKINGAELCGQTEVGRKVVYCTDTVYCESAVELAHDADVLIHEATFAHQDAELAYQRLHSTSTMAAQVALGAHAKQLIMTHFSPRYAPGNSIELRDLLEEARSIFPNTQLASDFWTYEVPRRIAKSVVAKV